MLHFTWIWHYVMYHSTTTFIWLSNLLARVLGWVFGEVALEQWRELCSSEYSDENELPPYA